MYHALVHQRSSRIALLSKSRRTCKGFSSIIQKQRKLTLLVQKGALMTGIRISIYFCKNFLMQEISDENACHFSNDCTAQRKKRFSKIIFFRLRVCKNLPTLRPLILAFHPSPV